jgi:hypothetical protein
MDAVRSDAITRRRFFIQPLLRVEKMFVAARMTPSAVSGGFPVLFCDGRGATTVASTINRSLPLICLHATLGRTHGGWEALRNGWTWLGPSLLALDTAFGGDGLESLHRLLFEGDLVDQMKKAPWGSIEQERVLYRAALLLGPDRDHVTYRHLVQSILEGSSSSNTADAIAYGPWALAASMAKFLAAYLAGQSTRAAEMAWALFRDASGIDYPSVTALVGHMIVPDDRCQPVLTTLVQSEGPWRETAEFAALQAAEAGGRRYDGGAHLFLARAQFERESFEAAWSSSCEACHRASLTDAHEIIRESTKMAHAISVRAGWCVLTEHTGRVLKLQEAM